jgi:hypothetical protein
MLIGRTLSNPNTSEEAKAHAREMLAEHEKKVVCPISSDDKGLALIA